MLNIFFKRNVRQKLRARSIFTLWHVFDDGYYCFEFHLLFHTFYFVTFSLFICSLGKENILWLWTWNWLYKIDLESCCSLPLNRHIFLNNYNLFKMTRPSREYIHIHERRDQRALSVRCAHFISCILLLHFTQRLFFVFGSTTQRKHTFPFRVIDVMFWNDMAVDLRYKDFWWWNRKRKIGRKGKRIISSG